MNIGLHESRYDIVWHERRPEECPKGSLELGVIQQNDLVPRKRAGFRRFDADRGTLLSILLCTLCPFTGRFKVEETFIGMHRDTGEHPAVTCTPVPPVQPPQHPQMGAAC